MRLALAHSMANGQSRSLTLTAQRYARSFVASISIAIEVQSHVPCGATDVREARRARTGQSLLAVRVLMEGEVIHDLDQSLEALLKRELRGRDQITVSFAAPDDQFSVKLPAVDLFLYDLRENLDLRSNDDVVERLGDGTAKRSQPAVRVDASYLITAWPGGGGGHSDSSEDEHRLLGSVMRALLRFRTLPPELLKGSLANQDLPHPVSTLQPGRLQSLGEFWQALGGKPKAALNYTVTLSVDVYEPEVYPLVIDKEIRIHLGTGSVA